MKMGKNVGTPHTPAGDLPPTLLPYFHSSPWEEYKPRLGPAPELALKLHLGEV